MRLAIRLLWAISVIGTVFVLFKTYGNLSLNFYYYTENAALHFTKHEYFYYSLAVITLSNLIFLGMHASVGRIPNALLLVPNRMFWISKAYNRRCLNEILKNWSLALASVSNYFLCYFMLLVENEYHADGSKVDAVQWFYIPGLLMLASMILPLVRLFFSNENYLLRTDQ